MTHNQVVTGSSPVGQQQQFGCHLEFGKVVGELEINQLDSTQTCPWETQNEMHVDTLFGKC
jgi:hypothetical protein